MNGLITLIEEGEFEVWEESRIVCCLKFEELAMIDLRAMVEMREKEEEEEKRRKMEENYVYNEETGFWEPKPHLIERMEKDFEERNPGVNAMDYGETMEVQIVGG